MLTRLDVAKLAKRRSCPRCSLQKTQGNALCRRCRFKLPAHMRLELESIESRNEGRVTDALRAAANYLDVHFRSIRQFRGGRMR